MSFSVATVQAALPAKLFGRQFPSATTAEVIRKAVLELTQTYMFPQLQISGPVTTFNQGQSLYAPDYFYPPAIPSGDMTEINRVTSIFLYSQPNTPPISLDTSQAATNSGYNLKWRTIDTLEISLNISGIPVYWTRHEGNIYIAFCPNSIYYCYARFQQENPFPNAGLSTASKDLIFMENPWQEIVEYCSAYRLLQNIKLFKEATVYHQTVFGDPKFQLTGGTEGTPGLIFHLTSQEEIDQTSKGSVKSLRMYNQPYQKGSY
jgi:hypothetical protein